uniref:Uncharacterized protein n=1 Tax=Avena sativa TaxID=4498 RepID=A0ACD5X584_AVESA
MVMQEIIGDDRLSSLPDDILLNILDRLNVCNAARTSILSGRWRHLPAMISHLKIDVLDFLHEGKSIIPQIDIARINAAVVEATKSMLSRRGLNHNTIHSLDMDFFLKDDHMISIGHVVGHYMATHKVEKVEFTVMTERDDVHCNDDHLIGYGQQFRLFFDSCPVAFAGLTHLRLENPRFGELDISNVLIICKRLQLLRLFNCDSGSSTVLQVEHPQISELSIVDCSFERVELNSLPKLIRMTFEGWISFQDPLFIGDVPLLEALGLSDICLSCHKMVKLSKFLVATSLRNLKLGFECEKIWVQPECLTKRFAYVFRQLRFVYLDDIPEGYDLTWTLFVLEVASNLKDLYLTVWDHLCKMETDEEKRKVLSYSEEKGVEWEPSTSSFQHPNLATLIIFGFQSEGYMVRYVRRVMEAAINLQDVFLYGRMSCKKCLGIPRASSFPLTQRSQFVVGERITKGINSSALVHFQTGAIRADHVAKMAFP